MIEYYRKYARTIFDVAVLVLTVYLLMAAFSYLFHLVPPLFYMVVLFLFVRPFIRLFERRGVPRGLAVSLGFLAFILLIVLVLGLIGLIVVGEIRGLVDALPKTVEYMEIRVNEQYQWFLQKAENLPPEVFERLRAYETDFVRQAGTWLQGLLRQLLDTITYWPTRLAKFLGDIFLSGLLTFFFALEYDHWHDWYATRAPGTLRRALHFLNAHVLSQIVRYLGALLKIVSVTGFLVLIGAVILHKPNPFLLALLAAVLEFVPYLGIMTFFVPWIVSEYVSGGWLPALYVLILYGVVSLARHILEPRIMGQTLGVSPFTMLLAIVLSAAYFGWPGVFLAPFLVILIKALYDQGYLKRWVRLPPDD
ncbi:AI-2E family transporter [Brockia lithotrophica]|uniref:Sporulation integral membrane protein YtvI n=1 Tax=Brockia lithotrophica TaxID=933949 RepID=A0A660LAR6_9BACL|nr:AI-2E family transporter [Brockia lithotrophica]RKQ88690.1 sporulation integral membrane protein YtvI [Brockia lithotrophica]